MNTSQFFENYVNNLQKDIFLIAYDSPYDIYGFITSYMRSEVRRYMDNDYTQWCHQPARRIFEEVLDEYPNLKKSDNTNVNKDAVEYLGFLYSKWHFLTRESSKTIIHFLPAKTGIRKYIYYHLVDFQSVIEEAKQEYNLSRNNHRKNEVKNALAIGEYADEPLYYSFLGLRIIYKLTKNPALKELNYVGDNNEYDFLDPECRLGFTGGLAVVSESMTILEHYNKVELRTKIKKPAKKSIYFAYVISHFVASEEESFKAFERQLMDLRLAYLSDRKFDCLYFYMSGKVYEFNNAFELRIYDLPLSRRDQAGVIRKLKDCGIEP